MNVEELIAELHKIPAEQREWPVFVMLWQDRNGVVLIDDLEVDADNGTVFIHEANYQIG